MTVSTQTYQILKAFNFHIEDALPSYAEAGFKTLDITLSCLPESHKLYGDGYKEKVAEVLKAAKACGISFNQSHAKFTSFKYDDLEFSKKTFKRIVREIEVSGMLGCKIVVVHPGHAPDDVRFDACVRFYRALEPYAEKAGVKIGIENMFYEDGRSKCIRAYTCGTAKEFAAMYDTLDSDNFTCLLDIGHAGLVGEDAAKFIRTLGHSRLTGLHVHDNDFMCDMHTLPFQGSIAWESVIDALADIDYTGDITLEADTFLKGLPNELLISGEKFMYETASYIAKTVEEKKKSRK